VKGIGAFVLVLLTALGIATFVVTRPRSGQLDAEGRAWVAHFSAWRVGVARRVVRAQEEIVVSRGQRLSARLTEPLHGCAASLARYGEPPSLLASVAEHANTACGEIDYALSVYARYGTPALATTGQHLHRAEQLLTEADTELHRRLGTKGS